MGPITIHANENLAPSDKGVALMRRRLREGIRKVAAGGAPMHVTEQRPNPVPTYGGDTVLAMPRVGNDDESALLSRLAHRLMEIQYAADDLEEPERVALVTREMRQIEDGGLGALAEG